MKARAEAPEWVQSLRTFLRDQVGSSLQVKEKKGNNTCLRIRYEDGSRVEKNLNIKWNKANSAKIRTRVEEIHNLMQGGVDIDEALERTQTTEARKGKKKVNPKTILSAWSKYETYKTKQLGDVDQDNWNKEYGGEKLKVNDVVIRNRVMGKTYKALLNAVPLATNANTLLIEIGRPYKPGSRSRQTRCQQVRAFLEWATSKNSKYLLDVDLFTPPPKGGISEYVGRKSRKELSDKAKKVTPTLDDADLLKLIESIPEKKSHDKWDFCLRLASCYGLRPIECSHKYLEIRKTSKGQPYLYCTHIKKSGSGQSKPRRLWPLHDYWQKDWNLIERVKRKHELPPFTNGASDGFKDYLKSNDLWKEYKEKYKAIPYIFRHSYGRRSHEIYKISVEESSQMMGHTPEVHMKAYSQWVKEESLEESMERAIKLRDLLEDSK